MDDVVSAQLENENLRKIRARLLRWEAKNNPLATLSNKQDEYLETIESICNNDNTCKVALLPPQNNDAHLDGKNAREVEVKPKVQMQFPCNSMEKLQQLSLTQSNGVDTTQNFLLLFDQVQDEIYEGENMPFKSYLQQLISRRDKCIGILNQIQEASQCLQTLKDEYMFVSEKTEHLNKSSEQLIEEQKILQNITDDIQHRLYYYNQVELLQQRLFSPTLSVTSEAFQECLCKMDECLNYLKEHPQYKETAVFTIKYKHCLNKAITLLRNYIHAVMAQCTEATLHTKQTVNQNSSNETSNHAVMSATTTMANTPDTTFALYYGKYQIASVKIKRIIQMIELRIGKSIEYTHLLNDLQQNYVQQRSTIMKPAVNKAINDIKVQHKSDHCVLMRKACAFLVHICQDEHRLYYQFFIKDSDQLNTYLESLCNILYDMMRPFVIHINHLETLAEICSILRIEMLEEHVQQNPTALETFGTVINQLLQDVQERLVFRAYLYLQSDILNYNPSAGDLAYPEKLEMMESIALSLQESSKIQRSDSRSSLISTISQNTDIASVDSSVSRIRAMNSPADLHGMWYPTVRRTLVCLSRLYRCVDRPIFQGLSQEALKLCIQSVAAAANKISQAKTSIDGELFEIKHMLILREQIAPFRVDFTIKETSLDFSKVKTAAFTLLQKRNQLFTMGSNNALLEFLLEGTPQIKEHMLDSRKAVDRQLKLVCERFIQDAVKELIGPLLKFLEHAEELLEQTKEDDDDDDDDSGGGGGGGERGGGGGGEGGEDGEHNRKSNNIENYGKTKQMIKKINYNLRQSSWASPQQISSVIQEAQRLIKKRLPSLQYSMQLYLSNRDTEFIIFRPIRNNVIQNFMKLEQLLNSNSYSSDDMIIASCPSTEQISILLSNTSILTAENVNNFSQQQHHHHQQQQQQQQQLLHSKKSENNIDPNRNDNSMKMSEAQNKNSLEKKVNFDSQTYQQQEQVQAETIVSVTSDSATSIH